MIIRDECPSANFLIDELEYSDVEIFAALRRCVDYWNEIPPPVARYSYSRFPYRYHWALGATGLLMRQVATHKLRNFLDYSAAGISVNEQGRWRDYQAVGDQYWAEYREWVQRKKYEININGGFGSISGWSTY